MPDAVVLAAIDRVRARLRLRTALWTLAAAGATAGAVAVAAMAFGATPSVRFAAAGVAGLGVAIWMLRAYGSVTAIAAAACIENCYSLDNLVVTTVELHEAPRAISIGIREEISRQAEARVSGLDVTRVVPMAQPLAVALAVGIGAAAIMTLGSSGGAWTRPSVLEASASARAPGIDSVTVQVVPPAYSQRPAETLTAPVQVIVVAGSRVRLMVTTTAEGVVAELAGLPALQLTHERDGFTGEWLADRSTAVAIRPAAGASRETRFLSVIVVPDAPPVVRVPTPGRDVAIVGTKGRITLEVDTQDDLGLASLVVKFTKASGGGESLTFTEGEVPLTISRPDSRHWRGRAEWILDGLDLSDGDVLVYRAIARDRNPHGRPVQSEQYLVEVGRLAGAVGSGFALPAEEKKYAISQQMVIYKTEQLIASATGKASPTRSLGANSLPGRSLGEGWVEQNQMLAIEQRMVRAEVVFLGGGEVQDEVEEAAHSHEVAEGRLANTGRAEMLRAINFMSQAEALLNDGNAVDALVREREALRSLERAFDRRRYFLRTLPDRSRIDVTRRLTGNLKDARSWTRDRPAVEVAPGLAQQRTLMRDLSAAANGGSVDAALAARVVALDPAGDALQQAAVALASASTDTSRRDAVWGAMQAVTMHALKSLGSAAGVRITIDPLAGRLADEMARPGKGRR